MTTMSRTQAFSQSPQKRAERKKLKNMIMDLRELELRLLLHSAGRSVIGAKGKLQVRAFELLKLNSTAINLKVVALHTGIKTHHTSNKRVRNPKTTISNQNTVLILRQRGNGNSRRIHHSCNNMSIHHSRNSDQNSNGVPSRGTLQQSGQSRGRMNLDGERLFLRNMSGRNLFNQTLVGTGLLPLRRKSTTVASKQLHRGYLIPSRRYQSINSLLMSRARAQLYSADVTCRRSPSTRSTTSAQPQRQIGTLHPTHTYRIPNNISVSRSRIIRHHSCKKKNLGHTCNETVNFKKLPFIDVLDELLRPSNMIPSVRRKRHVYKFMFPLTSQQVTDIASSLYLLPGSDMEYAVQIQMRICRLETSHEQDDLFPPGIRVKVNGKSCPLPTLNVSNGSAVDTKPDPRPVDITTIVGLDHTVVNTIRVSWISDENKQGYSISVNLVRKLTPLQLLQRLKARGSSQVHVTRDLIKDTLKEVLDGDIATTALRVSVLCPLGMQRMTTPCRATTCSHIQCFDAHTYLQMNEKKPTWICPICSRPALFDTLVIDGYFLQVAASGKVPFNCSEIQLQEDGSWTSLVIMKERVPLPLPADEREFDEYLHSSPHTPTKYYDSIDAISVIDLALSETNEDTELMENAYYDPNQEIWSHLSRNAVDSSPENSFSDSAPEGNESPSSEIFPHSFPCLLDMDLN